MENTREVASNHGKVNPQQIPFPFAHTGRGIASSLMTVAPLIASREEALLS